MAVLHVDFIQLRIAAHAVGEADLEKKFEAASGSLRRGMMFANSYICEKIIIIMPHVYKIMKS